jgi:hypothetical protein
LIVKRVRELGINPKPIPKWGYNDVDLQGTSNKQGRIKNVF